MSEPDDDIADTLIEGDSYEQAALSEQRMVPLVLATKIRLAVGSLVLSAVVAPAVLVRRDLVRSLEGTGDLGLALGLLALNGILTVFLGGLLLVRQRHVVSGRSLTPERARKLVHLEDFFALVVILGALFVVVPAALAVVGLLSPGTVETLYEYDIRIYRPDDTVGLDIRLVSAAGAVLAATLAALWRLAR